MTLVDLACIAVMSKYAGEMGQIDAWMKVIVVVMDW